MWQGSLGSTRHVVAYDWCLVLISNRTDLGLHADIADLSAHPCAAPNLQLLTFICDAIKRHPHPTFFAGREVQKDIRCSVCQNSGYAQTQSESYKVQSMIPGDRLGYCTVHLRTGVTAEVDLHSGISKGIRDRIRVLSASCPVFQPLFQVPLREVSCSGKL